jgi:hypothetical protein
MSVIPGDANNDAAIVRHESVHVDVLAEGTLSGSSL